MPLPRAECFSFTLYHMVSHYPKTRRDNFQVPSWGPPGRHGHDSLFLSAAWNLRPDAVTFGKSMASGRGASGFGHSHCSHCQSRYFNDLISCHHTFLHLLYTSTCVCRFVMICWFSTCQFLDIPVFDFSAFCPNCSKW